MANYYSAKGIKNVAPMVAYNVGYIDHDGKNAEVQLKVHAGHATEELMRLFGDYCKDNDLRAKDILYIEYMGPATDAEG